MPPNDGAPNKPKRRSVPPKQAFRHSFPFGPQADFFSADPLDSDASRVVFMNEKENLGANSMEPGSEPINLRKASTIPNAAAAASSFGRGMPSISEHASSPMTSLASNFAAQMHVSASAPCTARRSLNGQFDQSESSDHELSPRFDQQLSFRVDTVPNAFSKRGLISQAQKSRSCGDVGCLLEAEDSILYSPTSSVDSISGYSSESSTTSLSASGKFRVQQPAPTNSLAVSGTLPNGLELTLPIIKGSKAQVNSISCETVRYALNFLAR